MYAKLSGLPTTNRGHNFCIPAWIDELFVLLGSHWLSRQFKACFPQLAKKRGKAGWNKGWDVTRMIVLDLGVNSAILQCDPRTRLMRGPVSPAYAYR